MQDVSGLLIVDDHAAVRTGLSALFDGHPRIDRITAVPDGDQALAAVREHGPQVAIVDYHLPGEDGLRVCLRLAEAAPECRTVIYSAFADRVIYVLAAVAGADAVVCKTSEPDELRTIVCTLAEGGSVARPIDPAGLAVVGEATDDEDIPILSMLFHGTEPADIATTLGISPEWLVARRWAILRRFGPRRAVVRR